MKTKKQDHTNYPYAVIIGFFLIALSINLIKLSREYMARKQTLANNQIEYAQTLEEENQLKLKVKQSQTAKYIEEQARELTLSKPNEVVIILSSPTPKPRKKLTPTPYIANYKLWAQLFFKQ